MKFSYFNFKDFDLVYLGCVLEFVGNYVFNVFNWVTGLLYGVCIIVVV